MLIQPECLALTEFVRADRGSATALTREQNQKKNTYTKQTTHWTWTNTSVRAWDDVFFSGSGHIVDVASVVRHQRALYILCAREMHSNAQTPNTTPPRRFAGFDCIRIHQTKRENHDGHSLGPYSERSGNALCAIDEVVFVWFAISIDRRGPKIYPHFHHRGASAVAALPWNPSRKHGGHSNREWMLQSHNKTSYLKQTHTHRTRSPKPHKK